MTHPNPMVGAVIVDQGEIVSEGYHAKAGSDHAEVDAFKSLKGQLSQEATLYVTLEPCCTQGRTPPCTDAIIESKIRRVVVGAADPNPDHQGRGVGLLRDSGIEVETGVLKDECEDLNLIFNHWIVRRDPIFAGKIATTIDGRIATQSGHSKWITGEESRRDVMEWRRLFPAIAVGSGTVLQDNPRLTSRRAEEEWCPIRFVFDRRLRTVRNPLPKVYSDSHRNRTILVSCGEGGEPARRELKDAGIVEWVVGEDEDGVSISDIRRRCLEEGIEGVFLEGGSRLLSSVLKRRELDYLFCYRSPAILADESALPAFSGSSPETIEEGVRLEEIRHSVFGDDELMRGRVVYP